jgi:hypothetical protein
VVNVYDLPFGMELACQMENEQNRAIQIQNAFKSWASWDPKSARQWLEKSSLPNDVKADLLKQLEKK